MTRPKSGGSEEPKSKARKDTSQTQEARLTQAFSQIRSMSDRINALEETVEQFGLVLKGAQELIAEIQNDLPNYQKRYVGESIQKVEAFNGEAVPEARSDFGMRMTDEDKLVSVMNAIKILPPNHVVNGRQPVHNVEAIVGFKVSETMMNEAYELIGQP